MPMMRPWIFGLIVLVLLVYEGLAIYQSQGNTISEIIWRLTRTYPLVPFALGLLCGHFFWQASKLWRAGG